MRVGSLIPGFVWRTMATMLEAVTPGSSVVASRWLRKPRLQADEEVCVFVSYAPDNVLPEHSHFHARAWADAGFRVVLVLNVNDFSCEVSADGLDFAIGVLVRENRGYDFGAWACALHQLPQVREASLVALVNDSMYGPLDTFGQMLERARKTDADLIGMTESRQHGRHFQSFLLFFKPAALNNRAFWRFWNQIRAGGRIVAIYRYELRLLKVLEQAGLRCVALFSCRDRSNPTLSRWRELIDEGLPYVKVALLRDNYFKLDLSGWEDTLQERGFDPALAIRHLKQ